MADDVLLNKCSSSIERCLQRVRDEYGDDERHLYDDITRQDAIILNLQRACQAAIDLAMHLVRQHVLGLPQESHDAFRRLVEAELLDADLGRRLQRMVGWNVAVHNYQDLDLAIVQAIIDHHLGDFTAFTSLVLRTRGFRT